MYHKQNLLLPNFVCNNTVLCEFTNLGLFLQHMREAAEKRKQLENEHKEAVAALHTKQEEVQTLTQVGGAHRNQGVNGRRPQLRLLVKYIHKTVRTDTDRARYDWL